MTAAEAPGGPVRPTDDEKIGWHVYILKCADGSLYTGIARDPSARLRQHNAGRGAKYTRSRLPLALVYRECAGSRGDALRREAEIKRLPRPEKQRLIALADSADGLD